jgi:hypothetical protein
MNPYMVNAKVVLNEKIDRSMTSVWGNAMAQLNPQMQQQNKKPRKRKAISNGTRFNIFNRDNFRCTYCGRSSSEDGVKLEVDHIIPVVKGGKNTEENLTTACYECNRGKNAKLLNKPLDKRKSVSTKEQWKQVNELPPYEATSLYTGDDITRFGVASFSFPTQQTLVISSDDGTIKFGS